MRASYVVGASCADSVVGAIECYRVIWVSGPREVLVGADDGQDLLVGVWDRVDDCVCAWLEGRVACAGNLHILRD